MKGAIGVILMVIAGVAALRVSIPATQGSSGHLVEFVFALALFFLGLWLYRSSRAAPPTR